VAAAVLFVKTPAVTPGPGAGGNLAFTWDSGVVEMAANGVVIEAGGRTFVMPANASVSSDPGTPSYRTLEFGWRDQGVEMRLNIYFEADAEAWRVTEIRTYDGMPNGEWIYYDAPQLTAALGVPFTGDLVVSGRGQRGTGTLRFDDLRLDGFAAGTGVSWQAGCEMLVPVPQVPDGAPRPALQPNLAQFGITSGMDAREVGARLTAARVCHDFRLSTASYSAVWCTPPAGKVDHWLSGSEGQVILFVESNASEWDGQDMVGC
jgi:hypothetical protein